MYTAAYSITQSELASSFIEYEKVYLLKKQSIREEHMETLEYMKLFFLFRMLDFHKKGVESFRDVSGIDLAEARLAMNFHDES